MRDSNHFFYLSFPSYSHISFVENKVIYALSVCSKNSTQGSPWFLLAIADITTSVHLSKVRLLRFSFLQKDHRVTAFRPCWANEHKGNIMPSSHFLLCAPTHQKKGPCGVTNIKEIHEPWLLVALLFMVFVSWETFQNHINTLDLSKILSNSP